MKRKFLAFLVTLLIVTSLNARTITVNNNPTASAQYKRLDSAISAAATGDVLLVSGSVTDYAAGATGGIITINKPLTLYGQGYDPRNDQAAASTISSIHITSSGSGTTISGFLISKEIYEDDGTNNITISRCKINAMLNYTYYTDGINGNNYDIRENIIGTISISFYNSSTPISNIIIQNNIITGAIGGPAVATNITISNNYFTSTNPFSAPPYGGNLYNANIYNNIFYYKSTSATSGQSVAGNSVFNNNIYFNTSNANPFNLGANSNSGSNNINANPRFVNIDLTSTSVTRADNFNLQPGSPGINAGTDGKNIGPEGGSIPLQYPYSGDPAIPQIDSMSVLNPIISPNGTLNVRFSAHSNN